MSHAAKSWAFLTFISLTLIVLGHFSLGREGLLIGLVIGLGMNCYVYFFEDQRIIKLFRGRVLEGQDPWGLLQSARQLAARMRVPVPKFIILSDSAPQMLVVGRSLTQGTIIVTEGLLRKLSPAEINALVAYGLACILSLNTLSFSVASFIVNILLSVTGTLDLGLRLLLVEKKNPNQPLSQFFTRLASPIAGLLIRLSVRPSAYFNADRIAGEALENPKALAQALWKLDAYAYTCPHATKLSISHMYAINPLTQHRWYRYFHAQPNVSERIRHLVGYYPL